MHFAPQNLKPGYGPALEWLITWNKFGFPFFLPGKCCRRNHLTASVPSFSNAADNLPAHSSLTLSVTKLSDIVTNYNQNPNNREVFVGCK